MILTRDWTRQIFSRSYQCLENGLCLGWTVEFQIRTLHTQHLKKLLPQLKECKSFLGQSLLTVSELFTVLRERILTLVENVGLIMMIISELYHRLSNGSVHIIARTVRHPSNSAAVDSRRNDYMSVTSRRLLRHYYSVLRQLLYTLIRHQCHAHNTLFSSAFVPDCLNRMHSVHTHYM